MLYYATNNKRNSNFNTLTACFEQRKKGSVLHICLFNLDFYFYFKICLFIIINIIHKLPATQSCPPGPSAETAGSDP